MGVPNFADPSAALASDNFWILASTAIVAIGVVLEFFDLLLFNKEMTKWQRRILFIASTLVVVGCAGEFWFEKQAGDAESQIQRTSDERVAELGRAEAADKKIAQQAAANAAALGVKVDTLPRFVRREETEIGSQLAKFQKFALDDKTKTIDALNHLEADKEALDKAREDAATSANEAKRVLTAVALANRHRGTLTADQESEFVRSLAPFKPMRVDIFTFGDMDEIGEFGRELKALFEKAGWSPKLWAEINGAQFGVRGVPVYARGQGKTTEAANALVAALVTDHISSAKLPADQAFLPDDAAPGSISGPPWDSTDIANLRVFIGAKP